MNQKKNVLLIISAVLGVAYMIYSTWYWLGGGAAAAAGSGSSAELGSALAAALVTPHLVVVLIAVIFNVLALVMNKAAFALVAGILYAVSILLFFAYFMFVIIEMVLCFVAFAKMRKAQPAA